MPVQAVQRGGPARRAQCRAANEVATAARSILVTGPAGRIGAIGRNVTELPLKHGKAVRAMVRTDDECALALREMGAEVVVGDLLDLDSMHRAITGTKCW